MAAMRKNSRWASSSFSVSARDDALASSLGLRRNESGSRRVQTGERQDVNILGNFELLKRDVSVMKDVEGMDLDSLLDPFLVLLSSPLSTGPIASVVLQSLHKFLVSGVIRSGAPSVSQVLTNISRAISQCRFETSDSSGDEVVLYRILAVISECMLSPVGSLLGDVEVCELLETILTTCCQRRLSDLLRTSATISMQSLIRQTFRRLYDLDPVQEEEKLNRLSTASVENEPRMIFMSEISKEPLNMSVDRTEKISSEAPVPAELYETPSSVLSQSVRPANSVAISSKPTSNPYGLPALIEVLRVLINILDPHDKLHTDYTRLTALAILNEAFMTAGSRIIQFPSLASIIVDHGCKYLFQLARSENTALLEMSLRVITSMFTTMRPGLKLQMELFWSFTIDRLAPPSVGTKTAPSVPQRGRTASPRPGTPSSPSLGSSLMTPDVNGSDENLPLTRATVPPAKGETRQLILEAMLQISRPASFMVDLYANYDCDIDCEDLLQRTIDLLTKGIYPLDSGIRAERRQQPSQVTSLEMILTLVQHLTSRMEVGSEPWPTVSESELSPEDRILVKSRKQLTRIGASRFNVKPRDGIAFLGENGIIGADTSSNVSHDKSVATFLKSCTRLDKRLVGDYIARRENLPILREFIASFDFKHKPIADAMREMLETFRLPGESQLIERITETFAEFYFLSGQPEVKSQDAVHILSYAVIMLNTDQHNPQNRRRMTVEDFRRNLRGVNAGEDFSEEYLQSIYDSIKRREIVLPEEHTGQLGFEYAWKELLQRSRRTGTFVTCNSSAFDPTILKMIWKPVLSAIAHAFISFSDDYLVEKSITAFKQCATLAQRFELPEVFDFIVQALSETSGLIPSQPYLSVPNHSVISVEGQDITVSPLSVDFGVNFKGQLAAVVMFTIVNGNGNTIKKGWSQIFEMFQTLFLHSLLPTSMLQMEDFLGGVSMIPLRGKQTPHVSAVRTDGGLLSALSSYLMTPYASTSETVVPDPSDPDVENTLCAIDCITACRLDLLYGHIMELDEPAICAALSALIDLADCRTSGSLSLRMPEEEDFREMKRVSDTGNRVIPYDPASIFLLEMMVSIALHNPDYLEETWPLVWGHLRALLSNSVRFGTLLIERAVVGVLRLCRPLANEVKMRDQLYISLDSLAMLPYDVFASVSKQVMNGLSLILRNSSSVIRFSTEWGVVLALVRLSAPQPEAAQVALEVIEGLVAAQTVSTENFAPLTSCLEEFCTASSFAAQTSLSPQPTSPSSLATGILERGLKAAHQLMIFRQIASDLTASAALPDEQAWTTLTLPLLITLSRQSMNMYREISNLALNALQRILLGPQVLSPSAESQRFRDVFGHVVFPLLDALSAQDDQLSNSGKLVVETRIRASALVCKVFIAFATVPAGEHADNLEIWIKILEYMDYFMKIDHNEQLHEAIPEGLKNVILVLNASNILVPPSHTDERAESQKAIWSATSDRLEQFLPGFLPELVPSPPSPAPQTDAPVASE